jgi:DNA-binding response OmpR family regulator
MTAIMTVEDEFLVGEYLGQVLRDAGYDVIATADAMRQLQFSNRVMTFGS